MKKALSKSIIGLALIIVLVTSACNVIFVPHLQARRRVSRVSSVYSPTRRTSITGTGSTGGRGFGSGLGALGRGLRSLTARAAPLIAGLKSVSAGAVHSLLDARIDDPELRIGGESFMFVHQRSMALDEGYVTSEAQIEPFTSELLWDMFSAMIPTEIKRIHDEFKVINAEHMCILDFGILLINIAKRRVDYKDFSTLANRILMKASLTVKTDSLGNEIVDKDGNVVKSKLALQGPAEFYHEIPSVVRKIFDKIKFPAHVEVKERVAAFAKSPVAAKLLDIAARSRAEGKYSSRTEVAREWVDLVSTQGGNFSPHDLADLVYWAKIHAGEWETKVRVEDRALLKDPLLAFLKDLKAAADKSGISEKLPKDFARSADVPVVSVGQELSSIIAAVEKGKVSTAWATLEFPESKSRAGIKLGTGKLLEYMWHSFLRLSNKDYLGLYPFATLGRAETSMALQGMFFQFDRDINSALESFKQNEEGSQLWADVEEKIQVAEEAQQALRQARRQAASDAKGSGESVDPEAYADEQAAVNEANQAVMAAKAEFRHAASDFPYITTEEEIAALTEGREKQAMTAKDRLLTRLAELQRVTPHHFGQELAGNALFLSAIGFDLEDLISRLPEVQLNENKPNLVSQFVSEKQIRVDESRVGEDDSGVTVDESRDEGEMSFDIGGDDFEW